LFFKIDSTLEIYRTLQLSLQKEKRVTFKVLNPDMSYNSYAGELIKIDDVEYIYRGYKSWIAMAELLGCKMLTPKNLGNFVEITFKKIENSSFHNSSSEDKYGVDSEFFKINKMQEPSFIYYYIDALKRAYIYNRKRILNLGINRGDEFLQIKELLEDEFFNKEFVGVDYSKSAIEVAKNRIGKRNVKLYSHDINALKSLNLGKFDMLISIGTMQSSSLNYKELLMKLVQEYLEKDSAIVLGFPNCRWVGGEMIYGAKPPHYNFSEMGILFSDVIFAKKYLQQKKYRVTITGREYIFLVATKIGESNK